MTLAEHIRDIDLVRLADAEGVTLRRSGQSYTGRCPLHEDRTPSFTIKENRFRCWGCGVSGDAVDFIRQLRGLSFKEALAYLGLETDKAISPKERKEAKARVQERKRRQDLVKAFREWEAIYSTELGRRICRAYALIRKFAIGPEDLQGGIGTFLAEAYRRLPIWEEQLQILATGIDAEKFQLFKEVTDGT